MYEEKQLTWDELHQALLNDFEGQEAMRQILRSDCFIELPIPRSRRA